MAETEIDRLKDELQQQKNQDDRWRAQSNCRLKEKTEDFEKLYREHTDLEKEYDRQRKKLKEARSEVKEKVEALAAQDRMFKETKERLQEEVALERTRMLDERNQLMERSKAVLDKVQTTYQTKEMSYEAQAEAAATLIKQLKKEKETIAERVEMGIKRIRMIVSGRRK